MRYKIYVMSDKSTRYIQSMTIPKPILLTSKFLQAISPQLVTLFAARLFITPIKHKIPKRELEMDRKSKQQLLKIPTIGKDIMIYRYGDSPKKILLVHGWSGRGTQLVKFADALVQLGYETISFDAPAHGKSTGKTTLMPEFIASILEIDQKHGPFVGAIGHSLGGMSLLNATRAGLNLQCLVTIGSGDIVKDIMDEFVEKLELKSHISERLRLHFEKRAKETMDSYSAYMSARKINIPVFVIHDNHDAEVPVKSAHHIADNLAHGELMLTDNLGHRKILGNDAVIIKTIEFIKKQL